MPHTKEEEIQDKMICMRLRSLVALCGGLVILTNSFSLGWNKILQNEADSKYQIERTNKITKRTLEEAKDYYDRKILEEKLELCKQRIDETNRKSL